MPTATIEVDEETGEIVSDTVLANTLAGTIYDGSYVPRQLALLPEFESHRIDRIIVRVTGACELDPDDAEDVAFFTRLRLGEVVDFRVEGRVISRPHSIKREKDDEDRYVDVVTSVAGVKVTHAGD